MNIDSWNIDKQQIIYRLATYLDVIVVACPLINKWSQRIMNTAG